MSELVQSPSERSERELSAVQRILDAVDSPVFRPPMLPVVAQRAITAARDPGVDIQALGRIIEGDQVLAARFIAVANSPVYRGRVPTESVGVALPRLGLETTRDLLFFAAVEPILFTSKEFSDEMAVLRQHSLATASACAHLARFQRFSVEDASLAGLIHDLGAAAVYQYMAERKTVFGWLKDNPASLVRVLLDTHVTAGTLIAKRWDLPHPVQIVIAEHHSADADSPLIVKLVAAADELTSVCQLGVGFSRSGTEALLSILGDPSIIDSVVDGFAMRLAEVDGL